MHKYNDEIAISATTVATVAGVAVPTEINNENKYRISTYIEYEHTHSALCLL